MAQTQENAALQAMKEWLAHPQELGKAPARIECTGTFELHGLRYYLFRYKKTLLGSWLLGVCGGYEGDELEHCGHVWSEMEPYDESTAVEKATAMVEMIRAYWMQQAEKADSQGEDSERTGAFAGFVLLSDPSWDKAAFIRDLQEKWGLTVQEDEDEETGDDTLVFEEGKMIAAVSLMAAPIPNGEAELNAENNFLWPEAVDVTKTHQAHLMVAVLGQEEDLLERGKLYVKLLASCCRQKNALGVYTSGVVFEPRFYEGFADMIKNDDVFGFDEMEVLDADADPSEVRDFLASMVEYVLSGRVTLHDGETIGFSAEDKHAITRSPGVALPVMTLKISYSAL